MWASCRRTVGRAVVAQAGAAGRQGARGEDVGRIVHKRAARDALVGDAFDGRERADVGVQLRRPVLGILFYIIAAILGRFVHPFAALIIFIFVVAYYAWTSQGIRSNR